MFSHVQRPQSMLCIQDSNGFPTSPNLKPHNPNRIMYDQITLCNHCNVHTLFACVQFPFGPGSSVIIIMNHLQMKSLILGPSSRQTSTHCDHCDKLMCSSNCISVPPVILKVHYRVHCESSSLTQVEPSY